jgi:hypothetical protein
MVVRIEIGTSETKKNGVRDAVIAELQAAKTAGNIDYATWQIQETPIIEAGKI